MTVPGSGEPSAGQVFSAIASTERRLLLDELLRAWTTRGVSVSITELAAAVEMNRFCVSRHLGVLREAGLVRVAADGLRRLHTVDLDALTYVDEWLDPYFRVDATSAETGGVRGAG